MTNVKKTWKLEKVIENIINKLEEIKDYTTEVKELEIEIKFHKEDCMTCGEEIEFIKEMIEESKLDIKIFNTPSSDVQIQLKIKEEINEYKLKIEVEEKKIDEIKTSIEKLEKEIIDYENDIIDCNITIEELGKEIQIFQVDNEYIDSDDIPCINKIQRIKERVIEEKKQYRNLKL